MLTLYHLPNSRSTSIVWLLEELAVPYETHIVSNIRKPDGSGGVDPDNPHPHGKVPALVHDGHVVFEGGAIALYLTDLFPEKGLGPRPGEPTRGQYLSWLFYRSGVLEPAFMARRLNIPHMYGAMGWAPAEEVEAVLNAHLEKHAYFTGDVFTAADIMAGGGIDFMLQFKLMNETPVLRDYCARIAARPAYRRAQERDAAK